MKFEMIGQNFLGREYEAEIESSVIIPDTVSKKMGNTCEVLEAGPECELIKPGDIVIFPLGAGDQVGYLGEILLVGHEKLVRGIIHPDEEGFEAKPRQKNVEIIVPKGKIVN